MSGKVCHTSLDNGNSFLFQTSAHTCRRQSTPGECWSSHRVNWWLWQPSSTSGSSTASTAAQFDPQCDMAAQTWHPCHAHPRHQGISIWLHNLACTKKAKGLGCSNKHQQAYPVRDARAQREACSSIRPSPPPGRPQASCGCTSCRARSGLLGPVHGTGTALPAQPQPAGSCGLLYAPALQKALCGKACPEQQVRGRLLTSSTTTSWMVKSQVRCCLLSVHSAAAQVQQQPAGKERSRMASAGTMQNWMSMRSGWLVNGLWAPAHWS